MLRIPLSPLKPIKANKCNITIQGIQPWTLAAKGRIGVSQTICYSLNYIYKLKIHQNLHKSIHLQLCIALQSWLNVSLFI